MSDQLRTLLAAASAAAAATGDMVEACRDMNADFANGTIHPASNVGSGETAHALADALRLLLDLDDQPNEETTQLQGALARYLDPLI
ncbi:hypothetical protein [Tropicibacter sp. S64]|uniref:hypothetical protein n=1 Tax=Tropicibacter sp. S64 TaxID=3415122 RepID=UPI003C7A990A